MNDESTEEMEWSLARREFLADERDRLADAREATADERDALADRREAEVKLSEGEIVAGRSPDPEYWAPENLDRAEAARAAARSARVLAAAERDEAREKRSEARAQRDAGAPTVLAKLFSDIARELFQPGSLEEVLLRIVDVATDLVPGCDHASVTVTSSRGPITPVATADIARAVDKLQYEAGEGPCFDAMTERVVYTPDVGADARWPGLRTGAIEVCSVASFGLYEAWRGAGDGRPAASLNLYGSASDAMPEDARELGLLLAAYGNVALSVATERARAQQRDDDLHAALLSRDVIGQAKGILMDRDKLTADEAFDVLRRTSHACNRKLRDIAERLALTGELPPTPH